MMKSCVIGVESQLWTVHGLPPLACCPHEARPRVSVALSTGRQAAPWQQELCSQQQDVFGETCWFSFTIKFVESSLDENINFLHWFETM